MWLTKRYMPDDSCCKYNFACCVQVEKRRQKTQIMNLDIILEKVITKVTYICV